MAPNWTSEAEILYQSILAFDENERALEYFEDEDWDFVDERIFAPVKQLLCDTYGHVPPAGLCSRCSRVTTRGGDQ